MSDEAILALFTDLEDYGKYDPPVQKRGPDGSPLVDSEGKPEYESNRYNLSAFAGGGRDSAVDGFDDVRRLAGGSNRRGFVCFKSSSCPGSRFAG